MDEFYMNIALELAKRGKGKVNPNPLVGALIVKDGKILGQGYHMEYGKAHAEVNAFDSAVADVSGATMYVNLEPCSHFGKTPPCVDKIIENNIARVVIGMTDPNPLVAGRGIKKLEAAGIKVSVGVLEEECKNLNEVFIKYITQKIPFVVLKTAMSLDGKICTASGESKWITSEESRARVHNLRNELTGIMVGIDTILADKPKLTCRIPDGRNPVKIIVDSTLRIFQDCTVFENLSESKTIIATTNNASEEKIAQLESLGMKVLKTKSKHKKVDLQELMIHLGNLNIDSILLEGGSTLNYSALSEGIVDKIQLYIAPKIIGGVNSKTPVGGIGVTLLKDAFKVKTLTSTIVGEDILLEGYIDGGSI